MNIDILHKIYWIAASLITLMYTLFAPEIFFYKVTKKETKFLDRWKVYNLVWNLHQCIIHLTGSIVGFLSLDILIFQWGMPTPDKFGFAHLILLIIGVAGVMGYIPKILYSLNLDKFPPKS